MKAFSTSSPPLSTLYSFEMPDNLRLQRERLKKRHEVEEEIRQSQDELEKTIFDWDAMLSEIGPELCRRLLRCESSTAHKHFLSAETEMIADALLRQFRFAESKVNCGNVYVTIDVTKLPKTGQISLEELISAIIYVGSCGDFLGRVKSTNRHVKDVAEGRLRQAGKYVYKQSCYYQHLGKLRSKGVPTIQMRLCCAVGGGAATSRGRGSKPVHERLESVVIFAIGIPPLLNSAAQPFQSFADLARIGELIARVGLRGMMLRALREKELGFETPQAQTKSNFAHFGPLTVSYPDKSVVNRVGRDLIGRLPIVAAQSIFNNAPPPKKPRMEDDSGTVSVASSSAGPSTSFSTFASPSPSPFSSDFRSSPLLEEHFREQFKRFVQAPPLPSRLMSDPISRRVSIDEGDVHLFRRAMNLCSLHCESPTVIDSASSPATDHSSSMRT